MEDSLLTITEIFLLPHQSQKRRKIAWRGLEEVPPISRQLLVGQCVIQGIPAQVPRLPMDPLAHHTTTDLSPAPSCPQGTRATEEVAASGDPKELLEGPPQLSLALMRSVPEH